MSGEQGSAHPAIVPRWEWRTFGEPLDSADRALATYGIDSDHDSDETYLLSVHGDASVKIRDGLMDVKHLRQVDEDGLELWIPVMKAQFPLAADDVAAVFSTLNVDVPALGRRQYELEQLIGELIEPHGDLHAAAVHKRRRRYVIDECMVEMTEIATGGVSQRTVAVESPDTALVLATIAKLGLQDRRNVCVARGLKAMVSSRHAGVRCDRRRHQLGQVPPRRTACRRRRCTRSSIAPRSRGSARASTRQAR